MNRKHTRLLMGRMTTAERLMGRFMRGPDDHPSSPPADPPADPPAPEAIDPAKHASLASAHERLKKDAAADRASIKAMTDRLAAFETAEAAKAEEAARAAGDFDTIKKQIESRYTKEIEARDGTLGKQRTQIERLVIDAGLANALASASVAPEFLPAVTALLRQGAEIKDDDDGNPTAFRSGIPLAEAVKLWAENEGKAFVRLNNSGGDANGGQKHPAGSKTISRADFSKLDPVERAKAARELKIVD